MTREQMVEIIKRNESVIFNSKVISRIEDLPTEAEMAAGNVDSEQKVIDALAGQVLFALRQMSGGDKKKFVSLNEKLAGALESKLTVEEKGLEKKK